MKAFFTPLLFLFIFILNAQAQVKDTAKPNNNRCTTMENLDIRLEKDAVYKKFHTQAHSIAKTTQKKVLIDCDGSNTVVVPVAFHFQEGTINGGCDNLTCLLEAANDQLQVLNDAFGDNTGTPQEAICPAAYTDDAGNSVASTGTCISFCLAIPPSDNNLGLSSEDAPITYGIFNGGLSGGGNGASGWDDILNIFITNGSCLGIADGIPGSATGDGVTVCAAAFGADAKNYNCGVNTESSFNLGLTLVHEVGHYLGLYHVWGDGGCGFTDVATPGPYDVEDTPDAAQDTGGVPTACVDGCNGGFAPAANFMDYSDDAGMSMFTQDQAQVMNYWANQLFGDVSSNCVADQSPTEVATCSVTALFEPVNGSTVNICINETNTFQLLDKSRNTPVNWQWDIVQTSGDLTFSPSGNTATTTQNPTLVFTSGSAGDLAVTLTVTDEQGATSVNTNIITFNLYNEFTCPAICEYTINLEDIYGDGWNGGYLELFQYDMSIGVFGQDFTSGDQAGPFSIFVDNDEPVTWQQNNGGYPEEEVFTISNEEGESVVEYADGSSNSGTFTPSCAESFTTVQLKCLLEGFYDENSQEMNTDLNENNLIPFVQPFNISPFYYDGSESILFYPSEDVVDWVLVQAREENDPSIVLESRACFLLKDGTIIDIDGSTAIRFYDINTNWTYAYFSIIHKSHLGVLSADMVELDGDVYDFTSSQNAYGSVQTKPKGGKYVLYGGDCDGNGIINSEDYNIWSSNNSAVNQYLPQDIDGNSVINNVDYNYWQINRSKVGEPFIQY